MRFRTLLLSAQPRVARGAYVDVTPSLNPELEDRPVPGADHRVILDVAFRERCPAVRAVVLEREESPAHVEERDLHALDFDTQTAAWRKILCLGDRVQLSHRESVLPLQLRAA